MAAVLVLASAMEVDSVASVVAGSIVGSVADSMEALSIAPSIVVTVAASTAVSVAMEAALTVELVTATADRMVVVSGAVVVIKPNSQTDFANFKTIENADV